MEHYHGIVASFQTSLANRGTVYSFLNYSLINNKTKTRGFSGNNLKFSKWQLKKYKKCNVPSPNMKK